MKKQPAFRLELGTLNNDIDAVNYKAKTPIRSKTPKTPKTPKTMDTHFRKPRGLM